jgi:hypothetical protein
MTDTRGTRGRGLATLAAAGLLALSGAGLAACGDDKEGPAEDIGKEIDQGSKKAGDKIHEEASATRSPARD